MGKELLYKKRSRYDGEFKNDKYDGEGSYYWQSGDKYIVSLKRDLDMVMAFIRTQMALAMMGIGQAKERTWYNQFLKWEKVYWGIF